MVLLRSNIFLLSFYPQQLHSLSSRWLSCNAPQVPLDIDLGDPLQSLVVAG